MQYQKIGKIKILVGGINEQTGNPIELVEFGESGTAAYNEFLLGEYLVEAGKAQDDTYWATYTPVGGITALIQAEDQACLDDALQVLSGIAEDYPEITWTAPQIFGL
jgi:hypothetical protein